jgi:hypothetical protein
MGKKIAKTALSHVEIEIAEKWLESIGVDNDWLLEPKNRDFLRMRIKKIAYHEAGHFAAKMFTGLELSHTQLLSIIPNEDSNGQMKCERSYTEALLEQMPFEMQITNGLRLLMTQYAGYATAMILDKSEYKNLLQYLRAEEEGEMLYDDINSISDLNRARRICRILAIHYMPEARIHRLARGWTLEMLRIPEIWHAVETVAEVLISKGKITNDKNELSDLIDFLNVKSIFMIPKWKRRILPQRFSGIKSPSLKQDHVLEILPFGQRIP